MFSIDDIEKNKNNYKYYFKFIKEGKIIPAVSPLCELYMSKISFSMLYEGVRKGCFTSEEERLIKKYIPHTEAFENIDSVKFLLNNKSLFVLKPAIGFEG